MNKEDCKRVFVEKYKIYRTKKKNDYEKTFVCHGLYGCEFVELQ